MPELEAIVVVTTLMRFFDLTKTCAKLGISLRDYLGCRLKVVGHDVIEPLDRYVKARTRYT